MCGITMQVLFRFTLFLFLGIPHSLKVIGEKYVRVLTGTGIKHRRHGAGTTIPEAKRRKRQENSYAYDASEVVRVPESVPCW